MNKQTIYPSDKMHLSFLLLICLVLLNACNGTVSGQQRATATVVPSPTANVSLTLQAQGATQLQSFQSWIALMQQYGGDVSSYQQQYTSDQQALKAALNNAAYTAALQTLKEHITAIQLPALKAEATGLQKKLINEATVWGQTHTYHDPYNNETYPLGYEYGANGLFSTAPIQNLLAGTQTVDDYQYLVGQEQIWLSNFQAYQANAGDQTPYNQVHATDTQLMQQYGYTTGKVIVISLSEQAMRVYQDSQLVNSFLVVTGMPGHPSLPGTWWIESQQRNITFTSGAQPGEEGYYPVTPIGYAMQYHSYGYFLHESWWRVKYGPADQFPHSDPRGGYAHEGSHGCINMRLSDMQWLFSFAEKNSTKIIIY